MSVARAQREIDSREFSEWLIYEQLEPWGDDWLQSSLLASTLHNVHCTSQENLLAADHFVPRVRDTEQQLREREADIELLCRTAAARHNRDLVRQAETGEI